MKSKSHPFDWSILLLCFLLMWFFGNLPGGSFLGDSFSSALNRAAFRCANIAIVQLSLGVMLFLLRPGIMAKLPAIFMIVLGSFSTLISVESFSGASTAHHHYVQWESAHINLGAITLADRIPIQKPTSPKTFGDVMRLVSGPGLTGQQQTQIPAVLIEVAKRASRVRDVDLLAILFCSPDQEVRKTVMHFSGKIGRVAASTQALKLLGSGLYDQNTVVQYAAIYELVGFIILYGYHGKTVPPCPAINLFNANPDKYMDQWKTWWGINQEMLFKKVAAAEHETTATTAD